MYDLQSIEVDTDHKVVVVDDLAFAANRIYEVSGLQAVAGGQHPGHGTENWIIPLGPDYVELLTVSDPAEAKSSAFGRWTYDRLGRVAPLVDLVCLRTTDLDAVVERFGLDPLAMSRQVADGSTLSWRIAGLDAALVSPSLPFFIQWDSMDAHPGRMEANHRGAVDGLSSVDLATILTEAFVG